MMKNIFFALILTPVLVLLLFIFTFNNKVLAEENSAQNVNLARNEVINHDYFAAGNTVNINGTVNGDAYLAGGNITFDGVVNGDLLVAGGNVTILGKVAGDVRTVGGNIIVSSNIEKNATLLGGTISMSDSGKIAGSLVSAGGNISINSPIGKEVNVAGGQITLSNSIGSVVNAYTSNLTLTPATNIAGDLNYWSEKEIQINPEASISGKTYYHLVQTPKYDEKKFQEKANVDQGKILGIITGFSLILTLISFLSALISGLIMIRFLPNYMPQTRDVVTNNFWMSLGIGFLTVILFPMTFIILLATIIGVPIAFILLSLLMIAAYFAKIFVAMAMGKKLLELSGNNSISIYWSFILGLVVYYLISIIPIIGGIVVMFTYLIGIGAILIQRKNSYKTQREKNLI